jgi:4-hydroxy-tetrahydrodipicolinate reductase
MSYKVIQWGAGFTGRYSLRYILGNPSLELVGVKVFTDSKVGVDAGELLGGEPVGVTGTRDVEALLSTDADCVVFMPRDPLGDPTLPNSPAQSWIDELLPILRSGKNVVSSLAPGIHMGHLASGEALTAQFDEACREGGSTLLFTGLDPGFLSDALAVTMASAVGEITAIRTWEMLEYSNYPEADVLAALGFGIPPESLDSSALDIITPTWGSGIVLAAQALNVEIEDMTITPDLFVSPKTFTTPGGVEIREGTIGAVKWTLSGIVGGKPLLNINHVTRMAPDMAPDWPNVGKAGGYRIEIDSYPPFVGEFEMARPGGTGSSFDDAMAMTAARCVNAIQTVVQAPPGYKTILDLPPLTGQNSVAATVAPASARA